MKRHQIPFRQRGRSHNPLVAGSSPAAERQRLATVEGTRMRELFQQILEFNDGKRVSPKVGRFINDR